MSTPDIPPLPDELWFRILELGAGSSSLNYRDLCSLAIVCRRFRRLADAPFLWALLLATDFPPSGATSALPSKSQYKEKFERDKARKAAAWRRAVLNAESSVNMCSRRIADLEEAGARELGRMKSTVDEINNLENVRRSSLALNVWQPEIIRGQQRQLIGQCTVPVESRLSMLKMELKVCKKEIEVIKNAHKTEKRKLSQYEEALAKLKYHPLQNSRSSLVINEPPLKRRNTKQSN